MALAAAQVVDALATRLAALPATAGNVSTSRWWPWSEAELPSCSVFVQTEEVTPAAVGDRIGQHRLGVDCVFTVRAADDLDDALHALAAGALPLLFAPPVPYGLQLVGIDRRVDGDGEAAVGRITLQLVATFFADAAAPETIL